MERFECQKIKLLSDSFILVNQIDVASTHVEPILKKCTRAYCETLDRCLRRLSGNVTYETVGVKAGRDVNSGNEMSISILRNRVPNNLVEDHGSRLSKSDQVGSRRVRN